MRTFMAVSVLLLLIQAPNHLAAQGESAVPFLLIHPSPDANGRGNVGAAVVSDNPIAVLANPAQLGMFSLDGFFSASTYAPKTKWLPSFGIPDYTYDIRAVNAAYDLSRHIELPFRLGIGAGYSRIFLNHGTFIGLPGMPTRSYNPVEKSEQFSFGIGLEYFVKVGVGFTFKNILSRIVAAPFGMSEAKPSAVDVGLIVQAPLFEILRKAGQEPPLLFEDVQPLFDLTFGYARSNLGDTPVRYQNFIEGDPLPRKATIGLSAELGLTTDLPGKRWKLLTFTLAREAEDILVVRTPAGAWEFQSGLGDISFFRHVIQGRLRENDPPSLHKGWQLNIGECVYIRGGSFSESPAFGNRNYSTSGFAIRLSGLFKAIEAVTPEALESDILAFIFHHIDFVYDYAKYTKDSHSLLGGTTFNAVSVVIR